MLLMRDQRGDIWFSLDIVSKLLSHIKTKAQMLRVMKLWTSQDTAHRHQHDQAGRAQRPRQPAPLETSQAIDQLSFSVLVWYIHIST